METQIEKNMEIEMEAGIRTVCKDYEFPKSRANCSGSPKSVLEFFGSILGSPGLWKLPSSSRTLAGCGA